MADYNVNVKPLLVSYNHTNDGVAPLIPSDDLNLTSLTDIRGYGLYNPAPLYEQTTDRGHAYSQTNSNTKYFDKSFEPVTGELFQNPSGALDVKGTWESNINYNINSPDGSDYQYYDEYQRWALNASRKNDPYLLPYLFSKINVKFIQDSVVEYIKKARNITIETRQDTDNLLNLMLKNYLLYHSSNGLFSSNDNLLYPSESQTCSFQSILGNVNKNIIETYVQNVLSGLNMHDYYIHDISNLPIPLTNPVNASNKGSNVLGYVGHFEDNHGFTKNINSFNLRNTDPGKINSTQFGN